MCDQLGDEPDLDKMPPGIEDLPEPMQQAIDIFNMLGDRIVADIGYLGKDYSILNVYMSEVTDKDMFLETLAWLDGIHIKESAEQMKRERDKLKKK